MTQYVPPDTAFIRKVALVLAVLSENVPSVPAVEMDMVLYHILSPSAVLAMRLWSCQSIRYPYITYAVGGIST